MKRIVTLMLCLVLTVGIYPFQTDAATETEKQRISDQIRDIYWMTLSETGMESLHGYCGTMAGWELYFMGVTETAVTQNGNEMYDILSDGDKLTQGYSAHCYPVSQYTLEEALYTVTGGGTQDVYDLMVGFQWTNTAAGSLYGHVVVIHAILDGMVYFSEGFSTPFQSEPSEPMLCTISEFAAFYDSWASFEGLIHFTEGSYVAGCDTYGCSLFVSCKEAAQLRTQPSEEKGEVTRTVQAGERLYADALCQNDLGEQYYRIVEDGGEYFIPAEYTEPVWFTDDGLTVSDIALPEQVKAGKGFRISGTIRSERSRISGVLIEVTNEMGQVVTGCEIEKSSYMVDLNSDSVNTRVDIRNLPEGRYTYSVYCDVSNAYCAEGKIVENTQRIAVASSSFTVGQTDPQGVETMLSSQRRATKNGWRYEDGKWFYYENNACRTGWFCYEGVDYYLQEDGSAATGWQEINGKMRYFSETGAMRIGWLTTHEGTYYMLSNGATAIGQIAVGESRYFFGEDGKMLTDTTVELDGLSYSVDAAGIATPNR